MNKKGFSNLEMLVVIVVGLVVVIGGILIAVNLSKKAKMNTFKEDAEFITMSAKNAYLAFAKEEKKDYILAGEYTSMCISVKGLIKNGFLLDDYEKYEGYIVVEFKDSKYLASIWVHDKNFMIEGYEAEKISKLDLGKGISDFNVSAKMSASTSYGSASKEHGGTGINYSGTCVNDKV